MKNSIILLLFISLSSFSFAQNKFVQSVGFGFTPHVQFINENSRAELGKYLNYPGITFGAVTDLSISKRFSLNLKLNYENLKFVIPTDVVDLPLRDRIHVSRIELENNLKFKLNKNFEKNFGYLIAGISATYNLKSTISFKNEIFENTNDPYISNLTTSFGYGREFKLNDDFFLDINLKIKRFGWYYNSTFNANHYNLIYKVIVITPFCLNINIMYKL